MPAKIKISPGLRQINRFFIGVELLTTPFSIANAVTARPEDVERITEAGQERINRLVSADRWLAETEQPALESVTTEKETTGQAEINSDSILFTRRNDAALRRRSRP